MSEIYKLVQAIESYNESDLCLGTLRSLKKIKDAAAMLEIELADKYKQLAEARAEIDRLKCHLEDESMRADGMTTAHAEADARNYRLQELIEQMREALRLALPEARSTHCEQTILAALAAERGE